MLNKLLFYIRTFRTLSRFIDLAEKCKEMADTLARRLILEGLQVKTLTLKLKTIEFEVKTKAQTLVPPVSSADDLLFHALAVSEQSIDRYR